MYPEEEISTKSRIAEYRVLTRLLFKLICLVGMENKGFEIQLNGIVKNCCKVYLLEISFTYYFVNHVQ
jgi:hypothetical protein